MYERFEERLRSPASQRDRVIRWSQDISRILDYLETREDFDVSKIAYYGFSGGAMHGPVFTAVDARFAASVLLGAGGPRPRTRPEVHPDLFAPRSRTPTLMISGEDDFLAPYEQSQKPFFELLGATPSHKRHAVLAGGHIPTNRLEIVREVLEWLDRYLGPVNTLAVQPSTARSN
jgi:predicted esterase